MTRTAAAKNAWPSRHDLLGVYLNDHLAGAEELELLRLGLEGKAAGWRTLRAKADTDARLDTGRLDELISRASSQAGQLEELRVRAAGRVISLP